MLAYELASDSVADWWQQVGGDGNPVRPLQLCAWGTSPS